MKCEIFNKIVEWEHKAEKSLAGLFPNWLSCPYINCCPEDYRIRRESKLVKHYCSNNKTIKDCTMYRYLEYEK